MGRREDVPDESLYHRKNWSQWEKIVVPDDRDGFRRRRDEEGYRKKNIGITEDIQCGIYEIRIRRPNRQVIPVYIGSTCRERDTVDARIKEHCRPRSEKNDLINEVMENGDSLWVRVKEFPDKEEAMDEETEYLRRYDYAWNIRDQDKEEPRDIYA